MKRNFFTGEQPERICQYFNYYASRNHQVDLDEARLALNQENQFIIGREVRFCMQQEEGARFFAFYYYYNGQVKDNYLKVSKEGSFSIVDGIFSPVDSDLVLYFKNDQFIMHNPSSGPDYKSIL